MDKSIATCGLSYKEFYWVFLKLLLKVLDDEKYERVGGYAACNSVK